MRNDCLKQRDFDKIGELQKDEQNRIAVGGVILSDKTGDIVYKNTFDTRLNIVK